MSDNPLRTDDVLAEVAVERANQDATWGEQNHPFSFGESARRSYIHRAEHWKRINEARVEEDNLTWDGILLEEVFEALCEKVGPDRRAELVQVAAVAVAAIECYDRLEALEDHADEAITAAAQEPSE